MRQQPVVHSELASVFLALLPETLRSYATSFSRAIFQIPAKAAEVGDLTVIDDGDELTVVIGEDLHHVHFEEYCEANGTLQDRRQRAAENAVRWIESVIADRVLFRTQFSKGRLISSSSVGLDSSDALVLESADEYRDYTWSGQKAHVRCSG